MGTISPCQVTGPPAFGPAWTSQAFGVLYPASRASAELVSRLEGVPHQLSSCQV